MGVDFTSREMLLKYIGGLHSYLRHTILMFNPSNLDEICVHATHIEARGKHVSDDTHEDTFESRVKRKGKYKGKLKKNASMKMRRTSSHAKFFPNVGMMKIIA